MRVVITAFFLGTVAFAAIALGTAFVVLVLAETSGRDELRFAPAGIELLSFERTAGGSETSFGPALLLVPLVGGALNAAAAGVLRARGGAAP